MVTESQRPPAIAPGSYSGRPRVIGVGAHSRRVLSEGWQLRSLSPSVGVTPDEAGAMPGSWSSAIVPGTVASAARAAGDFDLDHVPDYDAMDWWYRCTFDVEANDRDGGGRTVLCFDGLATLADVWLNDVSILSSSNMFVAHEVDVTNALAATNELVIRFRSLRAALDQRRPRPRWRTRLVENQQLRWHRTTLLGRMPGWSPPVRAVGPWREVRLERRERIEIMRGDVFPIVTSRGPAVDVDLTLRALGLEVAGAAVRVGDWSDSLSVEVEADAIRLRGRLDVPEARLWWPHTHGDQPMYRACVVVQTSSVAGRPSPVADTVELDFGDVAFRDVTVDQTNGAFTIRVNDTPIFCRGACWTTPDIVSLGTTREEYRRLLTLARDGGMNMVRLGGTMVYEADAFYDVCDELGILVWQDFMFACMDYPAGDAVFSESVALEASQLVARLRRHASLAVLCGSSEVEQQAAMVGLSADAWRSTLFHETLPRVRNDGAPGIPYCSSSPTGGALPFHVNAGVAHYFGVGGYLRPIDDARRSGVRFAAECLGFSNVPEQRVVDQVLPNGESPVHHPRWKARVPRDHGPGWDFEDVRDHYLRELFGVDAMRLRYSDMERYLELSRVTTGEVMVRAMAEWRRADSVCHGALVWFFQDLWPGAGWGVLDAGGRPKAAYFALKRVLQPVALTITDEGQNGLAVHAVNDRAVCLEGQLTLSLVRATTGVVASASCPVRAAPRQAATISADAVFGEFHDLAYAYRFGPPGFDVMVASLASPSGTHEAFHFAAGLSIGQADTPPVSAEAARVDDVTFAITLRAKRLAQFVSIDAPGFDPDDDYFHMAPGTERVVYARAAQRDARFSGVVRVLNARESVPIALVGASVPGRAT
jgi:beta-mannosidase